MNSRGQRPRITAESRLGYNSRMGELPVANSSSWLVAKGNNLRLVHYSDGGHG